MCSIFCVFSVGFYQMAKIAVTPTIVAAEFILFKKKVSLRKVYLLELRNYKLHMLFSIQLI